MHDIHCGWPPMLFHQLEVLEELVQSGPFAYKGDQKSCVLALKYIFRWKWGGSAFLVAVKYFCLILSAAVLALSALYALPRY